MLRHSPKAELDLLVEERVRSSSAERLASRKAVDRGIPLDAELDPRRREAFVARFATMSSADLDGAEKTQGDTIDFVDAVFLERGARTAAAVGHLLAESGSSSLGTGFLISPRLVITNNHVLSSREDAAGAVIDFHFELDGQLQPRVSTRFALDPETCFLTVGYNDLDFTVVALGRKVVGPAVVADLFWCPMSDRPDKHAKGMFVNVVQHPSGRLKQVVVRENRIMARPSGGKVLHYEADTETGSSGSPVFNDHWEVVALHHWGKPKAETRNVDGTPIPITVNEGIRASVIVKRLRELLPQVRPQERALLEEALALGDADPTRGGGEGAVAPERQPGHVSRSLEGVMIDEGRSKGGGTAVVTVPLELSVRFLSPISDVEPVAQVTRGGLPVAATEPGGPEKVVRDLNYNNRRGYDQKFLPGIALPTPRIRDGGAARVAPLRDDQADFKNGVLKYQHFSVVINRNRRMALFTATNIDGLTYIPIDRDTGLPDDGPEGENWFNDPRMDPEHYVGQAIYSEISNFYDRGHLTRRTDPTWGTPARATRANADTFHRPNGAPQHWRFNQSTQFWQGVERHILEFGARVDRSRVSVFTGPVFGDDDPLAVQGNDIRIPLQFWKVVVRVVDGNVRATGLLVSQEALLHERRRFIPRPSEDAPPPVVDQFLCAIPEIERLTGLDFGALIRDGDTFAGPEGAPGTVTRKITGWQDFD